MFTKSIWNAYASMATYATLQEDIEVDTAIIGGGVTGIATALALATRGQRVAVLEARKIGGGTTSHSTGNIYSTIANGLDKLEAKYDLEMVKKVLAARQEGVALASHYVQQYGIKCDYATAPLYLYATEDYIYRVSKQLEVGQEAGLDIGYADVDEIPVPHAAALKITDQAQYNPMRFVQGLAAVAARFCQVYECSPVQDIETVNGLHHLTTPSGTVTAKHLVHATHTPKGIKLWHTLLGPYREYGIACKVAPNSIREGIYWGYYDSAEDKISTRVYNKNGETFLLVIGKPHKVGQKETNTESIKELEAFAHKHFDVHEVVYRWGGQHYRPADLLPYIGKENEGSNVYIATGFATDGLVWGMLASNIIADLITDKPNPWADMYSPTRHNMGKSAKEFMKENLNVAGQFIKDYLAIDDAPLAGIAPGMGDVVAIDGNKVAAYKSEGGLLQLCSAICPHLGCVVHFNQAEHTWDCPCHGSRFATDGSVLEGPALHGLKKVNPAKHG